MEFHPLERISEVIPHSPTPNQILAMCQRAFGPSVGVRSAREIGGGTFNTTFLITLDDQPMILRIAPAPTADLTWNERWLMRRELQIQPFFAALAALMPRTLMADFTHQLIDRDYMFQSFLAGERWDTIADEFTPDEQLLLWEQFGNITKTIHSTAGTTFGGPYPAPEFPTWSQTIINRLECATQAMIEAQLDVRDILSVLQIVRSRITLLDAIGQPRLLHGDLWLFNIWSRVVPMGHASSAFSTPIARGGATQWPIGRCLCSRRGQRPRPGNSMRASGRPMGNPSQRRKRLFATRCMRR